MRHTRFRVRDESGRHPTEILADLRSPRGLGEPARTIEEMMDAWSQSRATAGGATELYGDLATGEGLVDSGRDQPWPVEAEELASAAEQILAGDFEALAPLGQLTFLGRPATKYHGFLTGEDNGIPYESEITQIVSPPYLLLRAVRDRGNAQYYLTREVVLLEEGQVADSELAPS